MYVTLNALTNNAVILKLFVEENKRLYLRSVKDKHVTLFSHKNKSKNYNEIYIRAGKCYKSI